MQIYELMNTDMAVVAPNQILKQAAQIMSEHQVGALPVIDDAGRLAGMVTDRDIVCRGVASGKDLSQLTARDIMTKGITWCREEDDLQEALDLMERHKIRRLPVINANKRMVGILSLGDVSHAGTEALTFEMVRAVSAHH